ncbi:cupin-like domain-containing protein [Janthinobacterium fluminis]|uniref:Cupin-like domain-containing protein n=1 Tax=Janthinobacterium fluminis TaxID=2987524 RepID=A0ABT5K6X7_9BURK|nr:cupin-like domain-containing protein [Janthinobacterium fluminis]MDC8760763.1 cupin-like domain-containing protein [Janthinobacterium fluminis]
MYRLRAAPSAPPNELSHEWRRWIAENLILGSHPAGLMPVLLQAGIAEGDALAEIEQALRSPYIEGAVRLKSRLAKRDWVIDIYRKLNRLGEPRIERRHRLSTEQFLSDYYRRNEPVIITGMMDDWPAMAKWNLDYFKEGYAGREVEVQFGRDADQDYEMNSIAHKRKMAFGDYVDLVRQAGHTNDFYMTANNDSLNRQALTELWDDIGQLPEYLKREAQPRGFFWLGPAGTVTPFHHDLTNNFMAQVLGRKRLRIIPACEVSRMYNQRHCFTPLDGRNIDLQRFPLAADVQVLECVLEPGEILFLPVGCWHFVEGLDVSATVAFTNFRWDNDFYSNYPSKHDF